MLRGATAAAPVKRSLCGGLAFLAALGLAACLPTGRERPAPERRVERAGRERREGVRCVGFSDSDQSGRVFDLSFAQDDVTRGVAMDRG